LKSAGSKPGIGIVLGPLDEEFAICGVDFDGCVADGTLEPWADNIRDKLSSYTEISPSDEGAKTFFLVRKADLGRIRKHLGTEHRQQWKKGSSHYGIELHLSNSYFTVTGKEYGVDPIIARLVGGNDQLRVVSFSDLKSIVDMAEAFAGTKGQGEERDTGSDRSTRSVQDIREALMGIPNNGSLQENQSRDWWLAIGMALHHQFGGSPEGFALFDAWSAEWPGYDRDATEKAWRSFRRREGRVHTVQHIFGTAEKHGWRDLKRIFGLFDEFVEPLKKEPFENFAGLTFRSPSECEQSEARRYVIKGLVAEGDVACIVGAPGVGKSLLAPRLGYAVAQGAEIFGMRVRQGGVFYVAAEDEHGMSARVRALYREHGDAAEFSLVGGVSNLLVKDSEHLRKLRHGVKSRGPKLVVIDTLAMAFPGLEENSAEGMGRVIAVAKSLTKWGAAVVLVHHDTKDGQQGLPRGHSLLNGALDVAVHLTKSDGVVRAKLTKNRNGSCDRDIAFAIGTLALGTDEDGDPITAAYCQELPAGSAPSQTRLTPSALAALTVFRETTAGRDTIGDVEWRKACVDGRAVSASEEPDSRRKAFKRAAEELVRKGILFYQEDQYCMGTRAKETFDACDA
jgi:KaiC/GvpD/RAD55 family RecA-like ATPase